MSTKFKETELGLIPEDWNVLPISEIAEIVTDFVANGSFASLKSHVQYSDSPDFAVLVRLVDFHSNFDRSKFVYVNEEGYHFLKKSRLTGGEIIISNVGEYSGTVFRCPELHLPMTLGPNSIMVKTKYYDPFYYYWFKSLDGQEAISAVKSGSAVPKFNKTDFKTISAPVPSINEQQKIAEVLAALDEKIELNQKVNKTLESLAQAIFKKWFVDDADPKWETKKLGDLLDIDRGLSYKGKYLSDVGNPMFNLGSFNLDGSLKLDTLKYYSGDFKKNCTVNAGDIIVANTDMTQNRVILGSPCIIPDLFYDQNVLFTHHLYALRPIDELNKMFIYRSLKTREFKDQAIGFATGTTVLFLPKEAILNYEVKYPSIVKLKEFNSFYGNIVEQQLVLTKEIETLSQIRDSLLPRLMSGKLRVR